MAAAADGLDRPWARLDDRRRGGRPARGAARGARPARRGRRRPGPPGEVQGGDRDHRLGRGHPQGGAGSRDRLANTVDVSTLDQWLERNETYDQALRALYKLTPNVGKRVTKELKAAIAAEKAARARLPANSRGLVVIMSDIGQGWMNGGVIAIEEAKKTIADALEPPASASPDPATP